MGAMLRLWVNADRLTMLGPRPIIASLSLGATRTFRVRCQAQQQDSSALAAVPGEAANRVHPLPQPKPCVHPHNDASTSGWQLLRHLSLQLGMSVLACQTAPMLQP